MFSTLGPNWSSACSAWGFTPLTVFLKCLSLTLEFIGQPSDLPKGPKDEFFGDIIQS